MAHVITPGTHPNIKVMELQGELTYEDMTAEEPLGLHEGNPVYVLLDASKISVGLPPDFLHGARKSYFVHPNLAHMALYVNSMLLKNIGIMVAKLTRRKEKLTLHESREAAMKHLEKLVREAGL